MINTRRQDLRAMRYRIEITRTTEKRGLRNLSCLELRYLLRLNARVLDAMREREFILLADLFAREFSCAHTR